MSPSQHAEDILARANAIFPIANRAVQLDGSPQTAQVANQIRLCQDTEQSCIALAGSLKETSRVGATAGLAVNLSGRVHPNMDRMWIIQLEPDVAAAEKLASEATDEANKVVAARAEQQRVMQEQSAAVEAATTACNANAGVCKSKCDSGDGAFCAALGNKLWKGTTPPRLADAKTAMQKACDAGTRLGCAVMPKLDAEIQAAAEKVDELWGSVQAVGDDLATELGKRDIARSLEPQMPPASQMRTERAIQRMMAHEQTVIAEQYCPAKKAFVSQLGFAEFAKRVAAHCKNDPPVGSGQGGVDVPLTSQCQAAYASPCP